MRATYLVDLLIPLCLITTASCDSESYLYADNTAIGVTENGTAAGCLHSCTSLMTAGHDDLTVHYPNTPGKLYFYASQNNEKRPLCVVQPHSVAAVALAVKSIREHECSFAVKSGGHSIAGASAIHGGMVIDLKYLNQVIVSGDKETAFIGPGNTWGDVYRELELQDLAIVGGRVSSVGVGGFTMGGGISFLSRRYGWALDNVRRFQVVLPNGTVTFASENSHPDLYFALRGGGSNFGIVTGFDFKIYKHGLVWGGVNVYLIEDLPQRLAALRVQPPFDWTFHSATITAMQWLQKVAVTFGYGMNSHDLINAIAKLGNNEEDVAPHSYIFFGWIPSMKSYLMGATAIYSEPVEQPTILQNLTRPSGISSTNRLAKISDFTNEIEKSNPVDERQHWRTSTFKIDSDLISKLFDILIEESQPLTRAIPDALIFANIQLLTKYEIALFSRRGGNVFGINPGDGPLFFFSITVSYKSQKDDAAIQKLAETVISRAVELGKKTGLHHPFIYPNYAATGQNVFSGFPPAFRKRLREVQSTYDPQGEFASLQPDHFRF